MKRALFSLMLLTAALASADVVTSSNVLGVLPVTSASKRTIVSVPWCAMSATDDTAIQVSNLVKTANLTAGDLLHYVNSDGSYLTWRLDNGAGGVKFWQGVNIAKENDKVTVTTAAHNQTVARGNSIVLIRQNYTNENGSAKTFYLYGQIGTNSTVTSTIEVGTSAAPAYSLISSPKPAAWSVNGGSWSNVGTSDNLVVSGDKGWNLNLYWNPTSSKWGTSNDVYTTVGSMKIRTGREFAEYSTTVPAGQGVWYISKGGSGSPSVTWTEIPTK